MVKGLRRYYDFRVVLVGGAAAGMLTDGYPGPVLDGFTALGADELHIWEGSLDRPAPDIRGLRALLEPDELARADRFRFERDRARYVAGRGQLRLLLGRYLGRAPHEVRFEYGAYEKPSVAHPGLWFNLSHSGPVALCAVTSVGEVGIDVELDDPGFARERIAEHFFSPGEVATLRGLAPELQGRAFLTCWTRKEAFIKARGDGLSLALDSFDVTLEPGQPVALTRTAWSASEPRDWSLSDLSNTDDGYIAAVAVRGTRRFVIRRGTLRSTDHEILSEQEEL
jgi:4'-phosphopantetheinyl transferase